MPIKLHEHNLYDWRGVLRDLYNLQQTGTFCDVTLVTRDNDVTLGENHVTAHKVVLASRVPYFKAMFSSSIILSDVNTANLSQFRKIVVEAVVRFAYTGEVEVDDIHHVMEVFCLADYLQMTSLREQCEDYIFSNISLQSAVQTANFASSYSSSISSCHMKRILQYFLSHWTYITREPGWTKLCFTFFHQLVSSDTLNVRNENQVLDAVLEWVSADSVRIAKLSSLLQDVRLHAIPNLDALSGHSLILTSGPCLRLIKEGQYFAKSLRQDTAIRLKPRTYMDRSIYLFCTYKDDDYWQQTRRNNCNVIVYSKVHNAWEEVAQHVPRSWSQGTVIAPLQDSIYLLGNRQWEFDKPSHDKSDKVISFDRLSLSWKEEGKLPFPVSMNAGCAVSGKLFSCGGFDLSQRDETCVATSLLNNGAGWRGVSDMSCGRKNHQAVAFEDHVYALGGEAKGPELSPCPFSERWDAVTDRWLEFSNPTNNRTKFSATSTGDRICVFGGFNLNTDSLCYDYTWESYDPREGKWETPKPLPGKYTEFSVSYLEGDIYMMGGSLMLYGDENWSRDVHVYDGRSCKWRKGPQLPLRAEVEMCEVDRVLAEVRGVEETYVPMPTGAVVLY